MKYSKKNVELFKIVPSKKCFYWRYHPHQHNCNVCKSLTSLVKSIFILESIVLSIQTFYCGGWLKVLCTGKGRLFSIKCLYWRLREGSAFLFYHQNCKRKSFKLFNANLSIPTYKSLNLWGILLLIHWFKHSAK